MAKKSRKQRYDSRKRIAAAICAALVALAFFATLLSPLLQADAATSSELKKQVEEAKKNLEAAQKQLNTVKANKANVAQEVLDIDADITRAEDEIEQTEAAIEQNKIDLEQKETELTIAEANCIEYDDAFKTRARVMYENGTGSYLEVLLGATSFGDLLSRVEMIQEIIEYDKKQLAALVASRNAISEAKAAVEAEKEALELRQEQLEVTKTELDERLEAKSLLLEQLEADEEAYKKAYEQAEAEEKKIQKQLEEQAAKEAEEAKKNNSSVSQYTGSGKFQWPCPSSTRITSYYGYRIHPVYGTRKFHSGIDIGASYGSAIVAAESGTVTVATTSSGYGKYIIINHGSGITTLYAHCSSLLVSVGDTVTKGQTIAKVGSTGVSTGNHLHFEVRINGSTTDPLSYVK
ncbi:MAG: peptidoglycan DD-metalloendopeptidase family protein [Clostridia bacterium]|nr:peptidoglycan DD-metalloendopeptidase family protein [Clostridia bacterium]